MKKTLFSFILFCIAFVSIAQLTPVYLFQQDDTLLKRKYCNDALQKKNVLINSLKGDNSKAYKTVYSNMYEMVEDLLISSRSVTEHAADNYIKSVLEKIINSNPELKSLGIRVIFSRDYSPNAYSIGEGTIVLNAGLFVFLNNEAEMAFILCHELAHYYLDHSKKRIDRLIRIANSDSLKNELKRLSKQEYKVGEQLEKLLKSISFDIHRHGRDGEEEADRIGMQFLKNTGYSGKGFITSMQLMDKIDDTSLFTPLNLQKVLSFPGYPFKERWIKKESVIFGAMNADEASGLSKKERDSLKTHPDCSRRIELLADMSLKISGRNFQVDEVLFMQLKQDFIAEIVEEVYKSGNIGFNLYLSLQMLQAGRNIPLAVYSIVRDLNLIYKHQKEHKLGIIIDSESRYFTEEYNSLLRMLYRLRLSEITGLNTNICTFYQEQMKNYEGFEEEMIKAKTYQQSSNN